RRDAKFPQLGEDQDLAELRDEHQLAVGVDEVASAHRAVGAVDVHRNTSLRRRLAAAGKSYQFVQKIGWFLGNRQRIPAQPVGRPLGRVLPDRQGAWYCFGAMDVAEAALVLEDRSGRVLRRTAGGRGDDHGTSPTSQN